ncbi:NADH-quinone oxidoreductase subunit J family protein [Dyadobacter psychrotolerans]|uniref:NADH-quinone oxidoreductase subunit J n=1 Tax=Dyadobacter psychrotolerans TaxID=2541721 RepID=A0A4R5DNL6_9BACT|nr:NADH-quinone oxidoreductase subunit J [Dyadobacter psychrotolerans]TDE12495.1 NADH-quinone oxidoreductase subunit J [Dyadobacter psychrotolerans]
MEAAAFYSFSILAIISALFILFSKNLIYGAFALFLTFLGVAALYVLAGADFLAVTQIMVYVGGILVLMIFGIMLTQKASKDTTSTTPNRVEVLLSREFWGFLTGTGFFIFLGYIILDSQFKMTGDIISSKSTIRTIGVELMTSHLLPFEIAAILLLVALIGAAYLALNRNPAQ